MESCTYDLVGSRGMVSPVAFARGVDIFCEAIAQFISKIREDPSTENLLEWSVCTLSTWLHELGSNGAPDQSQSEIVLPLLILVRMRSSASPFFRPPLGLERAWSDERPLYFVSPLLC